MRRFEVGNVPCGACRLCCRNELVSLDGEDLARFQSETVLGKPVLAHKSNKECVYLTERGCSIHSRRPRICREFDCRVLALKLTRGGAKRLRCEKVWERGKQLLRLTPREDTNTAPTVRG